MTHDRELESRAREILNRHCEYMDGLDRGQSNMKTSNALAAVMEALSPTLGVTEAMVEAGAREFGRVEVGHDDPLYKALQPKPETMAAIERIEQANAAGYAALVSAPPAMARAMALEEALTPSAETKAEYIGEFSLTVVDRDEDGEEIYRKVLVPWDAIKEIMAAIRQRSARALTLPDAKQEEGR